MFIGASRGDVVGTVAFAANAAVLSHPEARPLAANALGAGSVTLPESRAAGVSGSYRRGMSELGDAEERMRLRYAGACRICGTEVPARTEAVYERATKTVRCLTHHDDGQGSSTRPPASSIAVTEPMDPGIPGASARREFERRRTASEHRIRSKHPKLGGLILAVTETPQSTNAWDTGARGEERLGARLNGLANVSLRVLHDRRIPKSRANIDHLAITPSGVFVIDAKKYKGRPEHQVEGGVLRPRVEKLMVGKRDRSSLVDSVLKQVQVVSDIVGPEVPVTGVLCFVEADWPLIGGAFSTRGVEVMWPKKLYKALATDGPLNDATVSEVHQALAVALPRA